MRLKLKTPPATEPLSLDEAKAYLRVVTNDEDALIASLIVMAREWCESFTQRAFITQTWTLWLDAFFPGRESRGALKNGWCEFPVSYRDYPALEIPISPLQSVTHIKTYAADDSATLFADTHYQVDTAGQPGRVCLRSWPTVGRRFNAVEIEFMAGYGGASDVPESIKTAIKLLVEHYFERKESTTVGPVPMGVQNLLMPYRTARML